MRYFKLIRNQNFVNVLKRIDDDEDKVETFNFKLKIWFTSIYSFFDLLSRDFQELTEWEAKDQFPAAFPVEKPKWTYYITNYKTHYNLRRKDETGRNDEHVAHITTDLMIPERLEQLVEQANNNSLFF